MSEAELAEWRGKVEAAGVALSELLRRAMARTRTWTAGAAEVDRGRTRELARIGSNLNQIARWSGPGYALAKYLGCAASVQGQ